ncbi:MAG: hypothetical protein A2Z16_06545 [Chloroflexi bacterium RBG_16_54_18]|jgi:uncharacterized membrane protein YeaQ/YmgE (transglycosylase-associated protein family)|nr:MAG: hypothetical protein A2Z16_06545 [Chloroflexi bacterium RBG_16_54_18]
MSLTSLIVLAVIAAVAGMVGQAIAGYSRGGCLIAMVVGFIGAYIGMWIANQFGLPEPLPISIGGQTFPILWAIIGSAIFAALLGLITRGRRLI